LPIPRIEEFLRNSVSEAPRLLDTEINAQMTTEQQMNSVIAQMILVDRNRFSALPIPEDHISVVALSEVLMLLPESKASAMGNSMLLNLSDQNEISDDLPLSSYWISTSHNTCIMTDQVLSEVDPSVFAWALLLGVRCIELDIEDGDNGVPVVCHGPLTGRADLEAVLKVIHEYAFVASDFPLIISLDTVCSAHQQKQVALSIRKILGELLYYPTDIDTAHPRTVEQLAPRELKGRIIIRGKKLSSQFSAAEVEGMQARCGHEEDAMLPVATNRSANCGDSSAEGSDDEAEHNGGPSTNTQVPLRSMWVVPGTHIIEAKQSKMEEEHTLLAEKAETVCDISGESYPCALEVKHELERLAQENQRLADAMTLLQNQLHLQVHSGDKVQKRFLSLSKKKVPPPDEMAALTALTAQRFPDTPAADKVNSYSIPEAQLQKILEEAPEKAALGFHCLLKHSLIRTYPPAENILSQNYNPQPLWSAGAQLVALNMQQQGEEIALQLAWFEQNGGCGYVPKANALRGAALIPENFHPKRHLESLHSGISGRVPCLLLKATVKFVFGLKFPTQAQTRYFDIRREVEKLQLLHKATQQSTDSEVTSTGSRTMPQRARSTAESFIAADHILTTTEDDREEVYDMGSRLNLLRVRLEVFGVTADHKREDTQQTTNLCGYGVWEETFTFPFLSSNTAECAQLYVEIHHDTAGVVAARAFPLRRLRAGCGVLQLFDPCSTIPALKGSLVCDLNMSHAMPSHEEYKEYLKSGEKAVQHW